MSSAAAAAAARISRNDIAARRSQKGAPNGAVAVGGGVRVHGSAARMAARGAARPGRTLPEPADPTDADSVLSPLVMLPDPNPTVVFTGLFPGMLIGALLQDWDWHRHSEARRAGVQQACGAGTPGVPGGTWAGSHRSPSPPGALVGSERAPASAAALPPARARGQHSGLTQPPNEQRGTHLLPMLLDRARPFGLGKLAARSLLRFLSAALSSWGCTDATRGQAREFESAAPRCAVSGGAPCPASARPACSTTVARQARSVARWPGGQIAGAAVRRAPSFQVARRGSYPRGSGMLASASPPPPHPKGCHCAPFARRRRHPA